MLSFPFLSQGVSSYGDEWDGDGGGNNDSSSAFDPRQLGVPGGAAKASSSADGEC